MKILITTIFETLRRLVKYGVPSHILSFGDSLGDNLLLTTLVRALNNNGFTNIWIKSDHDFLFKNNPDIKLTIPFNTLLSTHILRQLKVKIVNLKYTEYLEDEDRDMIPEKHIILKMADLIGLKGAIANKPTLYLRSGCGTTRLTSLPQIVIVTSTSGAIVPMRNKEWITERYQQIANRFRSSYQFIQLGTKNDAPLDNVIDLRGKTSVLESAAILRNSVLLISHVGFMMHLARAVDCRAVIVYGGREKPEQSGYACFENIYSPFECSPCWLHNKCDYDRRCMTSISGLMVEEAIIHQISLIDRSLPVENLYND